MKNHTIKVNVKGYYMEVLFDYSPASKGKRERGSGIQLEPDEPEEIEVTAIKLLHPADMFEIITEEVSISIEDVHEAITAYGDGD